MRFHDRAAGEVFRRDELNIFPLPFFLGLILGDYIVGSLWALYGPLQHLQTYKIYI